MGLDQAEVAADYDRIFAGEGLADSDAYYRWALARLGPEPGRRLLDVSCGLGLFLKHARGAGLAAHGLDISPVALGVARRVAPGARLVVGNAEDLPYSDAAFDYVTCLGSLEHYLNPWRGLAEMRRVLRPEGRALVFVPNSYYLADILWHVLLRGRGPSHLQAIERFATCEEWKGLLTMMGLAVQKVYRYNFAWPRSRADLRWYAANPRKILYLLSSLVTPFNLSYSFLYVCTPAEPQPHLNTRLPLVLRRPEGAPW